MGKTPTKTPTLTRKQRCFVDEYLIDLNGTKAAIRAGYSAKNANRHASRLLSKDHVSHAIEEAQEARSKRTEITQDWVLTGLREVAERCLQKVPVMEFDRTERRMVQAQDEEGKDVWQFDSTGANRSFELLGKHLGLFDKKLGPGDVTPEDAARKMREAAQEMRKATNAVAPPMDTV